MDYLIRLSQNSQNFITHSDVGKIRHSNLPEGCEDEDLGTRSLVSMEWDTCSPDYLLVAYKSGSLWLIDINSMRIVTKYTLPGSASVGTLAWLPDVPGLFVTGGEFIIQYLFSKM